MTERPASTAHPIAGVSEARQRQRPPRRRRARPGGLPGLRRCSGRPPRDPVRGSLPAAQEVVEAQGAFKLVLQSDRAGPETDPTVLQPAASETCWSTM